MYAALHVQGVLLGHPLKKENSQVESSVQDNPAAPSLQMRELPSRKETPRWRVLYRITRQLLHLRSGSFSQKIETANNPSAKLSRLTPGVSY